MLIDEATISVKAGHGGGGHVSFHKTPGMLGPTGGNGGAGGSVYAEGVSDLLVLRKYRNQKGFAAEDGKRGGTNLKYGRNGEDLVLPMPVGTIIRNAAPGSDPSKTQEVTEVGQRILLAKGGPGGRGNYEFRSSTRTSPDYAENGVPGEEFELFLELQLIADAGLIGLPNAGKSSLLAELTAATPKVGNYPFTTLEPNLGTYIPGSGDRYGEHVIIADIPGLIEGAASGKGLGTKFLRHVRRTKFFLHCVAADSEDVVADYKTIRNELESYDKELIEKNEYILLTKTDLVSKEEVAKKEKALSKFGTVIPVSIHDADSLTKITDLLEDVA